MTDEDVQEVVEEVDDLLQSALGYANVYTSHDEVRATAVRAFDKVEKARKKLDEIDEREWNTEADDAN